MMTTDEDIKFCGAKIKEINLAIGRAESDLYALRKNITEKQAEHKQILDALKKEQRSELGELQCRYGQAKHIVDKMRYEMGCMKKHRHQLRMLKSMMELQHKSVDEQEGVKKC